MSSCLHLATKVQLQQPRSSRFRNSGAEGSAFLFSTFANNGMPCTAGPTWGSAHGGKSESGGAQDIMVFRKQE